MIKTPSASVKSSKLNSVSGVDACNNQTPVPSTSICSENDDSLKTPSISSTSLKSVQGPPNSVSVSIDTTSIHTPKSYPTTTTTTITPYTGTNIDSSYLADSISTCAEVDYTKICSGCNNPFSNCYEGKWHKICLHRVLDYLKEKDFEGVSERSVRRVY